MQEDPNVQDYGSLEPSGSANDNEYGLSEEEAQSLVAEIMAKENFPLGVIAGLVSALVGALIWAAITVATTMQIGWMAVGVGFMVGFAIKLAGKGETPRFSYLGAACAFLGCLLGNYFAIIGFFASESDMGMLETMMVLDPAFVIEVMRVSFSPIDMLFYGLAIFGGFRNSVTH